jgi:hypothetical protein
LAVRERERQKCPGVAEPMHRIGETKPGALRAQQLLRAQVL